MFFCVSEVTYPRYLGVKSDRSTLLAYPKGNKIAIMLDECGFDYAVHAVNITAGDQFRPDFLKVSPNNRMLAIIDHGPFGGGTPMGLFESGTNLLCLT